MLLLKVIAKCLSHFLEDLWCLAPSQQRALHFLEASTCTAYTAWLDSYWPALASD